MSKSKSKTIDLPTLPPAIEMLAESGPFSGSTSLALAGRIMMAKHAGKLYGHLPGVLSGDDPHDIHQMRVATRRLRASLQSTAIAYKPEAVDRLRKQLRRLARVLGAVRDLDVLLIRLRQDVEQLDIERGEVDQRIERFQQERDTAHADLVAELLSKRMVKLLNRLNDLLLCPLDEIQADDGGLPLLVRHHAGSALWLELEAVERFETVMPHAATEQLHDLRIACKHLRYTLELFEPALGRDTRELIKQVETVQEHLGLIHDADVALEYFAVDGDSQPDPEPMRLDGIHSDLDTGEQHSQSDEAESPTLETDLSESLGQEQSQPAPRLRYADARLVERARLVYEFGAMWADLNSRETRRKLGKLIAKL